MDKKNKMKNLFAYLSIISAIFFIVLLVLLHFIEPEIDPSWRLISEYQLGQWGWLMSLAFFSLAISCVSLFLIIRANIHGLAGHIGRAFLALSAIGLIIAGIYHTGPITTLPEDYTFSMRMHQLGGVVAVFGMSLSALILTIHFLRTDHLWYGRAMFLLILMVVLIWAGFITWIGLSTIQKLMFFESGENAYAWIGYPNRIYIVSFSIWQILASINILRKTDQ